MKKIVYVLLFLIFISSIGQAYDLGLKLGINYAGVSGDLSESDYENIFSYNLGILGIINISPKIDMQTELEYTIKGFQHKSEFTDYYANPIGKLNVVNYFKYINLNLLMKYNLSNSKTNLNLIFGPNIAFFSKAVFIVEAPDKDSKSEYTDLINDIDNGITIGFNIEFSMLEEKFQTDVRYNHSLNALYDGGDWDYARHSLFSVSLCYIFYSK